LEEGRQRKHNKAKGSKDQESKGGIKRLKWDYLQVPSCMYDFLAIFCMHGTCMCVFGSLVIIGMVSAKCENSFQPFLAISE